MSEVDINKTPYSEAEQKAHIHLIRNGDEDALDSFWKNKDRYTKKRHGMVTLLTGIKNRNRSKNIKAGGNGLSTSVTAGLNGLRNMIGLAAAEFADAIDAVRFCCEVLYWKSGKQSLAWSDFSKKKAKDDEGSWGDAAYRRSQALCKTAMAIGVSIILGSEAVEICDLTKATCDIKIPAEHAQVLSEMFQKAFPTSESKGPVERGSWGSLTEGIMNAIYNADNAESNIWTEELILRSEQLHEMMRQIDNELEYLSSNEEKWNRVQQMSAAFNDFMEEKTEMKEHVYEEQLMDVVTRSETHGLSDKDGEMKKNSQMPWNKRWLAPAYKLSRTSEAGYNKAMEVIGYLSNGSVKSQMMAIANKAHDEWVRKYRERAERKKNSQVIERQYHYDQDKMKPYVLMPIMLAVVIHKRNTGQAPHLFIHGSNNPEVKNAVGELTKCIVESFKGNMGKKMIVSELKKNLGARGLQKYAKTFDAWFAELSAEKIDRAWGGLCTMNAVRIGSNMWSGEMSTTGLLYAGDVVKLIALYNKEKDEFIKRKMAEYSSSDKSRWEQRWSERDAMSSTCRTLRQWVMTGCTDGWKYQGFMYGAILNENRNIGTGDNLEIVMDFHDSGSECPGFNFSKSSLEDLVENMAKVHPFAEGIDKLKEGLQRCGSITKGSFAGVDHCEFVWPALSEGGRKGVWKGCDNKIDSTFKPQAKGASGASPGYSEQTLSNLFGTGGF